MSFRFDCLFTPPPSRQLSLSSLDFMQGNLGLGVCGGAIAGMAFRLTVGDGRWVTSERGTWGARIWGPLTPALALDGRWWEGKTAQWSARRELRWWRCAVPDGPWASLDLEESCHEGSQSGAEQVLTWLPLTAWWWWRVAAKETKEPIAKRRENRFKEVRSRA
jgi:hypothetical protein